MIFRYPFNRSFVFVQELDWHLIGLVYLVAAGYTMLHKEHVRVDILCARLSPRGKAWMDFVLLWVFFFPSCLLVLCTTWPFVRHSFIGLQLIGLALVIAFPEIVFASIRVFRS